MKKRDLFAIALILGLAFTLMVGLSVSAQNQDGGQRNPDRAQEPAAPPPIEPFEGGEQALGALGVAETVSHTFSYQGVLEEDGQPVTGDREMIFHLYNNEACTNTVGSPMTYTVAVDDGLFSVDLAFDQVLFNGQALWLEAEVEGTPLGCQTVQAVPYALGLRPGALISGSASLETPIMVRVRAGTSDSSSQGAYGANLAEWVLLAGIGVEGYNNVFGWGVYGRVESDIGGWGVHGYADAPGGVGVYGQSVYTNTNTYGVQGEVRSPSGVAGYFDNNAGPGTSDTGVAVVGLTGSGSRGDVPGGFYDPAGEFVGPNGLIGVASTDSEVGRGVVAYTYGTSGSGLYAVASSETGDAEGVYARSASENGYGVYGYAQHITGTNYGVYGLTPSPDGFGGYFRNTGSYGTALEADNDTDFGIGATGLSNGGSGVYGTSEDGNGVYGNVSALDDNYGLYTPDNLYSQNYNLAGATMQVVQNGGDQPLEAGDVVIFGGIGEPLQADGPPMIQVAKATSANDTGVAGVVSSRINPKVVTGLTPEGGDGPVTMDGPVAPGEYLLLVIQGPAQVKASGPIQAGDLLSSAGQAGYAAKAAELSVDGVSIAAPGTVFGKALEALDKEDGLIYVFVTLQ